MLIIVLQPSLIQNYNYIRQITIVMKEQKAVFYNWSRLDLMLTRSEGKAWKAVFLNALNVCNLHICHFIIHHKISHTLCIEGFCELQFSIKWPIILFSRNVLKIYLNGLYLYFIFRLDVCRLSSHQLVDESKLEVIWN